MSELFVQREFSGGSVGSGREARGKENPRVTYAVGVRTEPATLVRGSSRRITIMRLRPANIRVINRRNSRLDRDLRCLLKKKNKEYLTGHSISGGWGCCLLSSFWLSRRHFLRALDRVISGPSEVIFKSRQRVRQPSLLTTRGWRYRQALATSSSVWVSSASPSAVAKAGFPTFTLICFGFASSRFGMLSVSTPF
jgi:hypothetical protein